MTRRAVLVEASKIKGCNEIPGAAVDVVNYRAFLESAFGGSWESAEIVTLSHPSKFELMKEIDAAGKAEYSFVAFSGHGHHLQGKDLDDTMLCINDKDEVSVSSLNSGNPRTLIIADACRKVTKVEEEVKRYRMKLNEAIASVGPSRERCRALFDEAVERAEKGAIYMYSCGLDEAAGESNKKGGYFSRALVDVGDAFGEKRTKGVLQTNTAFAEATRLTTAKNPQQHPEQEPGRRTVHFPFAVFSY